MRFSLLPILLLITFPTTLPAEDLTLQPVTVVEWKAVDVYKRQRLHCSCRQIWIGWRSIT